MAARQDQEHRRSNALAAGERIRRQPRGFGAIRAPMADLFAIAESRSALGTVPLARAPSRSWRDRLRRNGPGFDPAQPLQICLTDGTLGMDAGRRITGLATDRATLADRRRIERKRLTRGRHRQHLYYVTIRPRSAPSLGPPGGYSDDLAFGVSNIDIMRPLSIRGGCSTLATSSSFSMISLSISRPRS